jgi:acyl-CoA synthetase (AMP-forming)/AMP-acid ligase II
MDLTLGRPGPSVQEVLATDVNPAPAVLLTECPATDQTDADVSIERYFSQERLARPTSSIEDGQAIAVVDGSRSVTFDELDRAADQVADGLRALGLGPRDRVAFVGRNCLACVELMLGAARAGVVVTIVNWRLHPVELSFVLDDCDPRVIVTTAEFAATVRQLPETARSTILVVGDGDVDDWESWRASQPATSTASVPHSDDDVVLQLYKRPAVDFVDVWPRSTTVKVPRRELREPC